MPRGSDGDLLQKSGGDKNKGINVIVEWFTTVRNQKSKTHTDTGTQEHCDSVVGGGRMGEDDL